MEHRQIFDFNVRWSYKNILMLALLAILPNLAGSLSHTTILGLRIHFFQIFIFLAAMIYGPLGGAISGSIGSIYVAMALNNPYVIFGNIILGFMAGFFYRHGFNIMLAALFAYSIQLPWLWVSDIYFANMPIAAVKMVVVSLLISNIIWAAVAGFLGNRIKSLIK